MMKGNGDAAKENRAGIATKARRPGREKRTASEYVP
jgi:hypothetical protein